MRTLLRILAGLILVAALGFWIFAGANKGWTKNRIATKTVDDVTGIEAITYEEKFVPGVDFLGGAALGAGALGGLSFLFRAKRKVVST